MSGRRQRAQGLIEYGLIAVTVAIMGAAGLNVLATAQKNYFTELALNPTPPDASNALLHPTSIGAPICGPSSILVNTPLTCTTPVVRDTFSNVNDTNPPWGAVNFYLDDSVLIATCSLPQIGGSVSTNQCFAPSITWTPAAANVGTHTITARYEAPLSNHLVSRSSASAAFVVHQMQFNPHPQCANELVGYMGNSVEAGSPMKCTVFVTDAGGPANNIDVTWTAPNDSRNGLRLLSCATNGLPATFASTLWDTGNTCKPASTLHCITGMNGSSAGQCSVIYRRIRMPVGGSTSLETGSQDLTVSMLSGSIPVTSGSPQWPGPAINVVNPSQHEVKTWLNCTSTDDEVEILPEVSFPLFLASFQATGLIRIHGTSGDVSCTQTAADMQPSTALDCVSGPPPSCGAGQQPNPDRHDGHAPIGTMTLLVRGVADPSTTCTLGTLAPLGPQAPNQTPYVSRCGAVPITLTGSIGAPRVDLTTAEAGLGAYPTHDSTLPHVTQVEFVSP